LKDKSGETTFGHDRTLMFPGDAAESQRTTASELRASLVVINGEEIGREYEITATETTIGRGDSVAVRVFSRSVSRCHAAITRMEEAGVAGFHIRDLNSMNGTLVNNERVTETVLHDGDKVQTGEIVFKFLLQDAIEAQFHREVHRLIYYDQLTGLMTMDSFRRLLDDTIATADEGEVFTLAMTDLDGLKRVNDTHGHLAGRMVVQGMGAMMRGCIRPQDRAALYGGDEAILLFPGTGLAGACIVAEQLRKTVEQHVFEHHGKSFQVSISQGLAEWPRHGRAAEDLIAAADMALYDAKAKGRNRVSLADIGNAPTVSGG
jgi:diguanylate cyclase (GGDEF)-like protein